MFPGINLLARNSLLNFCGNVVPLAAAIVVIPHLVTGMGIERFGVLSLIWIVIGYFGLFDLGIARATTKFISEHLALGETELLRDTIWTSLAALTGFGLLGGGVLAALIRPLVTHILHIPAPLQSETSAAFLVLSVSIPLLLASAGLRGILEAHRCFSAINAIKIPVGVMSIIAPLLVLPFSHNLRHIALSLLVCRLVELVANGLACRKVLSGIGKPKWPWGRQLQRLLGYGGWLTVSSIVGPLMTYLDRFIVGALLTMSAVAWYAPPYDVVTKQGIIPASLLAAVFPNLCRYAAADSRSFVALYRKSTTCLMAIMAPCAVILIIFARPLLKLWLGEGFAGESTAVVQILALGVFLNGVAQVPYAAIQALGRPDITAKLHLMEFPFYLCLLWILVTYLGITGAALAWTLRVVFDAGLLFRIAHRMLPTGSPRTAVDARHFGNATTLPLETPGTACRAETLANHV
jgi:O-antigen/teichoic acid export membrane protein